MNTNNQLEQCTNIRSAGLWADPQGEYPRMPLYEIMDPPAAEWNGGSWPKDVSNYGKSANYRTSRCPKRNDHPE